MFGKPKETLADRLRGGAVVSHDLRPLIQKTINRDLLVCALNDTLPHLSPASAAMIIADAVTALVASGKWSEQDGHNVGNAISQAADRAVDVSHIARGAGV